jgi:6-phosphofructokinase 1
MEITNKDFIIDYLGEATIPSPIKVSRYYSNSDRIRYKIEYSEKSKDYDNDLSFQATGPHQKIYFDPITTVAGIVTCGGLSPGINSVIRSIVYQLTEYGVRKILGFKNGFAGLLKVSEAPLELSLSLVEEIHLKGGTILGSSRGGINQDDAIENLKNKGVNILFCIGGDGTLRGANSLNDIARKKGYKLSVIGIPKTIDNDVPFVYQSFGFSTAVEKAKEVIVQAHTESSSYKNSISVVKLMGREAGFITLHACLAAQLADIALIPEVQFDLVGSENSLVSRIKKCLLLKKSCVVVVAEGAGQNLFDNASDEKDLSGNKKFNDIGIKIVETIKNNLPKELNFSVKYFDPSYSIRAIPANISDSVLCDGLARAAVDAAMSGITNSIIGIWYNQLVYVPMKTVCGMKKRVNPNGNSWQRLVSMMGV